MRGRRGEGDIPLGGKWAVAQAGR